MRHRLRTTLTVLLAPAAVLLAPSARGEDPPAARIESAIGKARKWLAAQQNPDGGYGPFAVEKVRIKNASDVGITAFALYALAKDPRRPADPAWPPVARAVELLLSKQQPDGGFYDPRDPTLQNYKTSVTLLALTTLDRIRHAEAIQKAQKFIKAQQLDEDDGFESGKKPGYGGFSYGGNQRYDLSNTQFALEALAASGVSGSDELWTKAVVFIARCQNGKTVDAVLKELNIGTSGDGGYRYTPDDTRGPAESLDKGPRIFSSYGSMTYAALKSLLYANVSKQDPRVADAFAWIARNFTVIENPGMATKANPKAGQQGLYYYYHTMAKALSVYGQARIKDDRGVEHDWAAELGAHLVSLQDAEGFWKNTSERWFEEIPVLATSFAMVALVECEASLGRQEHQGGPKPAGAAGASPPK